MRYAYIEAHQREHSVRKLCRVLKVTESGYYAWKKRPEGKRERANRLLGDKIQVKFADHRQRYGSPRIYRELKKEGEKCGKHRVERLMKCRNLRARAGRKYRVTTNSDHIRPIAPNILNRDFTPVAPNRAWAGDITYLWTSEGWVYLAVFLDLFSRKVIGWAISTRLTGDLVHRAFEHAWNRRNPTGQLLIHTDRGCQYAAHAFRELLTKKGLLLSMSRRGNCWDNAVVESFFHTLKVELTHKETFETRTLLERELFEYIERYYNQRRMHSTLDYLSPKEYESKSQLVTETLVA